MITPRDFVERWAQSALRENQSYQSHFNELCQLIGHKPPTQIDPEGTFFTFEENVEKATGGRGRADVWYKGHFAWEYKGKHKNLDEAYAQVSAYRGGLDNPPLLVVSDFIEYRIYPQWPNTSGQPFVFKNEDLLNRDAQNYIRWLLQDPDKFKEERQSELERREKITLALAEKFAHLADLMRIGGAGWTPMQIARFLTRLVFALFAEDVELLPRVDGKGVIRFIADGATESPESFERYLRDLFRAMDGEVSDFAFKRVPYFNGGLFAESSGGAGDGLEVLDITQIPGALDVLREVSEADWKAVNPTIFGTLFEGALDRSKRAQLGAHYTGEADIRLMIEPVLMQPLYRQWDEIRAKAEPLLQTYLAKASPKAETDSRNQLIALHDQMMDSLGKTRVLDPACGSGNFLYMSLRALKDLEGRARQFFEPLGLPFKDVVTPRQLYGIEKDEFAARLAFVVVWIGYLQWRFEDEGILRFYNPRSSSQHPHELPNPIIQDKLGPDDPEHIVCDDAIMRYDGDEKPYEPDWPLVDVIVGNPPFLGGKWMQGELGEKYKTDLWSLYTDRINRTADLVTHWFEKARSALDNDEVKRVGLLATNTIRQGDSADILKRIKQSGDFFFAYTDHPWTLDGASLRVALVGFDDGTEQERYLNGERVSHINADLTTGLSLEGGQELVENEGICFRSGEKNGPFEIPQNIAQEMLLSSNKSGRSNADVVRPYLNAMDMVQRSRGLWLIDFNEMTLEEAQLYERPFEYIREHVKPIRDTNNRQRRRENWWQHGEIMPSVRHALSSLDRFIVTPLVSKHRIFNWLESKIFPDVRLIVFARDDDYFFGVLHSYIHENWSLRLGAQHGGERPTYNVTSCFDNFPFPWSPGKEDTTSPLHAAISAAAKQLYEEREAWLNPPDLIAIAKGENTKTLLERTLTNVYNALEAHRAALSPSLRSGEGSGVGINNGEPNGNGNGGRIPKAARDFAPRLGQLHAALDRAVLSAYGWDDLNGRLRTPDGDEELLRRLLALNLARAGA